MDRRHPSRWICFNIGSRDNAIQAIPETRNKWTQRGSMTKDALVFRFKNSIQILAIICEKIITCALRERGRAALRRAPPNQRHRCVQVHLPLESFDVSTQCNATNKEDDKFIELGKRVINVDVDRLRPRDQYQGAIDTRGVEILKAVYESVQSINIRFGDHARYTPFSNVVKCVSRMTGVSSSTVQKICVSGWKRKRKLGRRSNAKDQESGSEESNNEEKIEYNEDEIEKKRSKTEPVRNVKNSVVKTEDCAPGPSLPLESRIIDESGSDDPPELQKQVKEEEECGTSDANPVGQIALKSLDELGTFTPLFVPLVDFENSVKQEPEEE
ncbi:hypothetical protein WR25_11348 [Diploscapter pachys]|uniref:Uncharacterized protein n=1 Tax=Diploscapter pachys TaxID=2018661 RepID=A0A2A2LHW7_9BILA|nr:hypothetical protein WR25_11348 [Diploscapter pachys]